MLLFNNILQKWPKGRAPVECSCPQWEVRGLESSFPHETGSVHYHNDIFLLYSPSLYKSHHCTHAHSCWGVEELREEKRSELVGGRQEGWVGAKQPASRWLHHLPNCSLWQKQILTYRILPVKGPPSPPVSLTSRKEDFGWGLHQFSWCLSAWILKHGNILNIY